jgi:competence protein ComEA
MVKRRKMMEKSKTRTLFAAVVLVTALATTFNAAAAEQISGTGSINLNTATTTELSFLPGIGESKARAIIQHRAKRPFKKVEDLMRVKGIGRKTFKKLSPYLAVDGSTTVKTKIKIQK